LTEPWKKGHYRDGKNTSLLVDEFTTSNTNALDLKEEQYTDGMDDELREYLAEGS